MHQKINDDMRSDNITWRSRAWYVYRSTFAMRVSAQNRDILSKYRFAWADKLAATGGKRTEQQEAQRQLDKEQHVHEMAQFFAQLPNTDLEDRASATEGLFTFAPET